MEDQVIMPENIISRDHIDEVYALFVNISDNQRFSLTPLDFINVFSTISEKRNLLIDKEMWNQIFFQIDYNKDGRIDFQDLLRFIYANLKIILGEVGERLSFNRLK